MSEGIQRKLSAILAADVAGYSRLMGEDEAGTLNALRQLRTELLGPKISGHRGKIVKSMGDGWLVEFASVTDAVTCAIEVQEGLAGNEIIKIRLGVHLGDITHEDDDIYGDGVNIAARLQEIAEPGAIVISDIARRSIDGKLAATFNDLGAHTLKNISEQVTAYGWGMTAVAAGTNALPLPDRQAIAVLPFDNMSGDPEQEYFADGITEDIITALSMQTDLFVIARNSTFTYKGHVLPVPQIGRELGVHFVLEGSVRKAGKRLRITALLIDAIAGDHLWAEKYDRDLDDIFEIQDEITMNIVASIGLPMLANRAARTAKRDATDLPVWDLAARATHRIYGFARADISAAWDIAEQVLERDTDNAWAHAIAANCLFQLWVISRLDPAKSESLDDAVGLIRRSLTLNEVSSFAQWVSGNLSLFHQYNHDAAIAAYRRSLEINPNFHLSIGALGMALAYIGDTDVGIGYIERAMRASPRDPSMFFRFHQMAHCLFIAGRHNDSIAWAKRCLQRRPDYVTVYLTISVCHVQLSNLAAARESLDQWRASNPDMTIAELYRPPFKNADVLQCYLDGLRKAGLPE